MAVALQRRRFVISPQLLLGVPVDRVTASAEVEATGRAWCSDDLGGFVRLLARAYAGTPVAEAFAPEGRLEEWVSYVAQVVKTPACGIFLPDASVVGSRYDTRTPGWRRSDDSRSPRASGTSRRSPPIPASGGKAWRDGWSPRFARQPTLPAPPVTLVVDERNEAARALYDGLGFGQVGTMLLASRGRVTRVASRSSDESASRPEPSGREAEPRRIG